VVVIEAQFSSFEFFTETQMISDISVCDAALLFEGFTTFGSVLLPFVLKGQTDRDFCKVGTEFLFLFRWGSGFIGPQGVTMLSLISNYPKKSLK
jgi:hypothetical protein